MTNALLLRRRGMMQAGGGTPLPYDSKVEFLLGNGNEYINTGINTATDIEISAKVRRTSTSGNPMIWANNNTSVNRITCYIATTANQHFGNKTVQMNMSQYFPNGTDVNVKENKYGIYINGTKRVDFNAEGTISGGDVIYLFWAKSTTAVKFTGRFYNCEILLNGVHVFNAYPVRVGTVGYMYDQVSGQLFGNVGTGAFGIGPDIV